MPEPINPDRTPKILDANPVYEKPQTPLVKPVEETPKVENREQPPDTVEISEKAREALEKLYAEQDNSDNIEEAEADTEEEQTQE